MKPLLRYSCVILALIMMTVIAAKGTTVTATAISSGDGQLLTNAKVTAEFVPKSGVYGFPVITSITATSDVNGTFTMTLTDVNTINPKGGTWKFIVCPNATVPCIIIPNVVITGTTQEIGGLITSNIPALSVTAQTLIPKAYSNTEVPTTDLVNTGAMYWNVLNRNLNIWDGTLWTTMPLLSGNNIWIGNNCFSVGPIDVKACYGARGDGITNDTTVLQTAINAATSSCRALYLPTGNYLINATLVSTLVSATTNTCGFKMFGDGPYSSVLVPASVFTGTSVLSINGTDPTHQFFFGSGGFLTNFGIASTGTAPTGVSGISITGEWKFLIQGNRINALSGDAIVWPLRLDISSNPDSYASAKNIILNNELTNNGGTGLNDACGLCAGAMVIISNLISNNFTNGLFIASHGTNIMSNTIAGNGGNQTASYATATGGGILVDKVQTNPRGVRMVENQDMDSNARYHIWLKACDVCTIENNAFISHANGAIWTTTVENIPPVDVILATGTTSVRSSRIIGNYIRSDALVSGTPDITNDSPVTGYLIDTTNSANEQLTLNQHNTLDETGNFIPYGTGGGGVLACTGTITVTCTIVQGGYYVTAPDFKFPAVAGCAGTGTTTLTNHIITAVSTTGVTCTTSPGRAIIPATTNLVFTNSNTINANIYDATGAVSRPTIDVFNSICLSIGNCDIQIQRNGVGLMHIHNGTANGEAMKLYRSRTDSLNGDFIILDATGGAYFIGSSTDGTGTVRALQVGTRNNATMSLVTSGVARFEIPGAANTIRPSTAGSGGLGDINKPFSDIWLGTSGTSYHHITSAATTNRAVSIADSGGTLPISPGTPTVGRAVCWKTATTLGFCSTVPDATGACTCN